jgi:hypothetical protein
MVDRIGDATWTGFVLRLKFLRYECVNGGEEVTRSLHAQKREHKNDNRRLQRYAHPLEFIP